MNQRKFTLEELTRLVGNLRLSAVSYSCEVCERNKPADMVATSTTGTPIFLCIMCATHLMGVNTRNAQERFASFNKQRAIDTATGLRVKRSRKAVK